MREDLGWIPLVTPTSQIVVSQATFNVLMGRYKIIANHTVNLLKGMYGETPAPVNKELQARVLKGADPISVRPAELTALKWPELERKFPGLSRMKICSYMRFSRMKPKDISRKNRSDSHLWDGHFAGPIR